MIRFYIEKSLYEGKVKIYGRTQNDTGIFWKLLPINIEQEKMESPQDSILPFLVLEHGDMQRFFDALIEAGFKSSEEINESSRIEAIKYHLEDMRTLVFNKKNQINL